ncbi:MULTISPECIES: hypothetical protein [unclassified Bosea (in: a-proteobacteria)]|nr:MULTISPECIES: hypothetical protein [unclassified Bosea (in: a-proteobacteria)]CAD5299126.1 hypothetical protein BOSE7B_60517 [Bosea sp. 7B]
MALGLLGWTPAEFDFDAAAEQLEDLQCSHLLRLDGLGSRKPASAA